MMQNVNWLQLATESGGTVHSLYPGIFAGKRWNTASAYLRPVLGRPNLKTEVRCLTTKILFDGKRAVGVEYMQNGQKKRVSLHYLLVEFSNAFTWLKCLNFSQTVFLFAQVFADKEVILSGGAINSPQLLMLSGVGNADDLKELGIPVVQHLPGAWNRQLFLLVGNCGTRSEQTVLWWLILKLSYISLFCVITQVLVVTCKITWRFTSSSSALSLSPCTRHRNLSIW